MLPDTARVRLATARSTGSRAVEEAEEAAHRASDLGGQPPKCSGWPIWEYMTAPDFEQDFRGSVVRSAWKSHPTLPGEAWSRAGFTEALASRPFDDRRRTPSPGRGRFRGLRGRDVHGVAAGQPR